MYEAPELDSRESEVREEIRVLGTQLRHQMATPNRWVGPLRRMTMARNVQGSNSIEGINAHLDDVAAIGLGEKPTDTTEQTERELAAYQLAMTYVLQLAKEPPVEITPSLVKALHFMTTSYDMTKWPGRLRRGAVYVEKASTGDIVHEGADADGLPQLLSELTTFASETGDSLIRAAMTHLNLVLIHPFRDGNGRISRIMQALVLAADGDVAPVFMSVEEYLGAHTQAYYDVLAKVGRGNWSPESATPESVRPWIRFMLTAHLNQAKERVARVEASARAYGELEGLLHPAGLPERTLEAAYEALLGSTVTRGRYLAALADGGEEITPQTATRDLTKLTDAGLLVATGAKRGKRYSASESLIAIRRKVGLGRAWNAVDPFEN